MLTDEGLDAWLRMMGPIRLYAEGGTRPILVATPDGRETHDVPLDVECEPLELPDEPGAGRYYLGLSRPNDTPAAQLTQFMTFLEPGDTFTLTRQEVREAIH